MILNVLSATISFQTSFKRLTWKCPIQKRDKIKSANYPEGKKMQKDHLHVSLSFQPAGQV